MIKRYTTPYHNFILPFLADEIEKVTVTYSQNGTNLVSRLKSTVTITDISALLENAKITGDDLDLLLKKVDSIDECSLLTIHLTQEETASFTFHKAAEKNIALVEIHILDKNNESFVSRPIRLRVYGTTTEEVI